MNTAHLARSSLGFFCILIFGIASLLAAAVVLRAADTTKPSPTGFSSIGVQEFEKLRADKKTVVLDVRTPREYAAGHIPGATNIDVNAPDFDKKVKALDTNTTYLVHCAAGVRSARACDKLSKQNFGHLYNLDGGFRAWEKAGNKAEK